MKNMPFTYIENINEFISMNVKVASKWKITMKWMLKKKKQKKLRRKTSSMNFLGNNI